MCFAAFLTACVSDSPAGSSSSSSASSSSSSGGGPVAGNLLANPGFEVGGCANWRPGNSFITDEPSAVHGGKLACRVCIDDNPGTSVYGVSQRLPASDLKPGVVYRASAWVRTGTPAATQLHVGFIVDGGDDFTSDDNVLGAEVPDPRPFTDQYHQVQSQAIDYKVTDGATSLYVEFINRGADRGCFIIDDAVLAPQ